MRKCRALLGLLFFLVSGVVFGQLREYVAVVEPEYDSATSEGFAKWAGIFAAQGQARWEEFFRYHAGELGAKIYGSGWVYLTEDRQALLITNKHVVLQASSAKVVFEDIDGNRREFTNIPILYVDQTMDLAILGLPENSFAKGFPLNLDRAQDGMGVFAVGFPGFGNQPLWQFSTGIVSNAAARIDPAYSYLIQHTASIDTGNSGGPLLIPSEDSDLGYAVLGINTLKATERENTGFAIPSSHILEAIKRTEALIALGEDQNRLRLNLEEQAKSFARVISAQELSYEDLRFYISYAFVGTKGFESYIDMMQLVPDQNILVKDFIDDPIESMRKSINLRIMYELLLHEERNTIEYVGINSQDNFDISQENDVRTNYQIGETQAVITWTWEYGRWMVKDANSMGLAHLNYSN